MKMYQKSTGPDESQHNAAKKLAERKKLIGGITLLILSIMLIISAAMIEISSNSFETIIISGEVFEFNSADLFTTEPITNSLITIAVVFFIISIILFVSYSKNKNIKEKSTQPQTTTIKTDELSPQIEKTELRCEYCNGIILKDDTYCDHCGAKILDRNIKK